MTDENIENKESLESQEAEEATPTPETEGTELTEEEKSAGAEQSEAEEDGEDETGTEKKEVKIRSYTQDEVDAMAAAARKQGLSKGKKEMLEQLETIIPEQIYDPATSQPMDPTNPLYTTVKQKFAEDATLKYNKRIQVEQASQVRHQQNQQKELEEAGIGYNNQIKTLDSSLVKVFTDKCADEWSDSNATDGMLYIASTSENGIETLGNLIKNDPETVDRISRLPKYKQANEMQRLIDIRNKGKGTPIKKSNAPKPAASHTNGGATSIKKSPKNQSYEDIKKEMRQEMGII